MKFRRNYQTASKGQIKKKALMLTISIFMLFFLISLSFEFWKPSLSPNIIKVQMLDKNHFIVANDTTNYERFASLLKSTVICAKQKYNTNKIELALPTKAKQSKDISAIINVVAAMDLDWEFAHKNKSK